ncbi:MAG: hypothetical protein O3B13_25045 [Planctomycetota bacterium]|nr:hypothetical protein [Planctomycetota bacterium]
MAQPNSQSVTTTVCTCGYLERSANDPDSPFVFDEAVNQYHFTFPFRDRGDAQLMIYHCPWCGGVASDSHRGSLFHDLDPKSCDEIIEKTASCQTLDDVIAILGTPNDDEYTGIKHNEKDGRSPRVDRVRRITFHNLYDEMSVSFEQLVGGSIGSSFIPKPLESAR